jgi:hypothetical protein
VVVTAPLDVGLDQLVRNRQAHAPRALSLAVQISYFHMLLKVWMRPSTPESTVVKEKRHHYCNERPV